MKPDSNNAKQPPRKVFDITRPGKTPASATSRPVISSRQAVKDQDFSADPDKSSLLNPKQKITIQSKEDTDKENKSDDTRRSAPQPEEKPVAPPSVPDKAESPAKPDAHPAPASSASQAPGAPPLTEQPSEQSPSKDDEAPNLGSAALDGAQTEENAVQATASTQPPAETAPKALTQSETESTPQKAPASDKSEPAHMNLPQHFASENVVVSHHRKHQNLWAEILAVLIILLLLAAILNVLLDAEIIQTNLIPHTNWFD
jgi:hypothetical protein